MSHFQLDCPHCGTKKSGFNIHFEFPAQGPFRAWETLCSCSVCKDVVVVRLIDNLPSSHPPSPSAFAKGDRLFDRFQLVRQFPRYVETLLPDGTPENVRKPLVEATESLRDGRYSAAAACFRKAIERSLKHIDPELEGRLHLRIRQLAKSSALPQAMIDLADQVRLLGNHAMHEDDIDPTKEDCAAAKEFCELFLTYVFSLPLKIEAARANLALTREG